MYEFTSRVRYSEVGPDFRMKLSSVAARMQDCSVFHSSSIGRGPEIWIKEKRVWIIVNWQIIVHELPYFETPVTTRTWAYSFHAFEGDRNFTLRGPDGRIFAEANSRWVYFDRETERPVRVPPEESDGYGLEERLTTFEFAPRRIALPKTPPVIHPSFEVVPTNIDTNQHVNNLQYIDMALAYLPEGFDVGELRVSYIQQSRLGDVLTPKTWEEEDRFYVSLENAAGKECAGILFIRH